ncbi:MAG: PIG-L family deacetylase [Candidatus Omnitrophica bacterium]|nr:PIG-L family deacetylase [Candidatus Omnitrophota bacterium]
MLEKKLNIMAVGAHPDDVEEQFGGTAMLYSSKGHRVLVVSMTNGDTGHQILGRKELADRRRKEAYAAGKVMNTEYKILPIHDGELVPSLANRKKLLKVIRKFRPDIIFTHSPAEYHPDHRYTTQLVLDTSYLVIVPNIVPEVPPLKENPCYFYFSPGKPQKSSFNFCFPIDSVWDRKLLAWHQHASQMYEWLPWTMGILDQVPVHTKERLEFLSLWRGKRFVSLANEYRPWLIKRYGKTAEKICYAEAVYSAPVGKQVGMNRKEIEKLFFCI